MKENVKIFINADDFGLTKSINKGVIESATNGILNSVSIMVNAPATIDAVNTLKKYDKQFIRIGLHINLVGNQGCVRSKYDYLTDQKGNYPERWSNLFKLILLHGNIILREIESESRRQIEVLKATGLDIDHLDSHDHTHCFPPIANIFIKLALEYGIPYIRCPVESAFYNDPRRFFSIKRIATNYFGYSLKGKIGSAGLTTSNSFWGVTDSGAMTAGRLINILNSIQYKGIIEIMCHPGFVDRELKSMFNAELKWDSEVKALTHPKVISIFNSLNGQ